MGFLALFQQKKVREELLPSGKSGKPALQVHSERVLCLVS